MTGMKIENKLGFAADIIALGTFIYSLIGSMPFVTLPYLNIGNQLSTSRMLIAGLIIFAADFGSINLFIKSKEVSFLGKSISSLFAAWLILFGVRDILFADKIGIGFLFSIIYISSVSLYYFVYNEKTNQIEKKIQITSLVIFFLFWLLSMVTSDSSSLVISVFSFFVILPLAISILEQNNE
jgi:hypothetical protein